jgi:hypothetical protein
VSERLVGEQTAVSGDGYAPPAEHPPLGSYAALSAVFAAGLGGFLFAARRQGRLPAGFGAGDLALVGIASHKISRLIAKDKVTAWLRAPFRRYVDQTGPNEMSEETRGDGARAAAGELIGCPYCLGLWVAAAMAAGLVVAPEETRFVAGVFTALTISDFMQIGYHAAQEHGLGLD